MSDILDLIGKIGETEDALLERLFVSPIFYGNTVATRVSGMTYTLKVRRTPPGWYVLKATDHKHAKVVETASLEDIEGYLKHLERVRLIMVSKTEEMCQALPMKVNKQGFAPTELLPVFLVDDRPLEFDRIVCRFDGANIWFEDVDMGNDPAKGEYLREQLQKLGDPKALQFAGLNFEERAAYGIRFAVDKKIREEEKKRSILGSVQGDVEHAGGKFINVTERRDHIQVTFEVDGERYTSTVSKTPQHNIISAGICLSGGDAAFDLKSLITVMREGQNRDLIHRW